MRVVRGLPGAAGAGRRIVNFLSYLLSAVIACFRLPPRRVVATRRNSSAVGRVIVSLKRVPLILKSATSGQSISCRLAQPLSLRIRNSPTLDALAATEIVTVGEGIGRDPESQRRRSIS